MPLTYKIYGKNGTITTQHKDLDLQSLPHPISEIKAIGSECIPHQFVQQSPPEDVVLPQWNRQYKLVCSVCGAKAEFSNSSIPITLI